MNIEKILESIEEAEFSFSIVGDFKTVNRAEDGYQHSGDAKIIYRIGRNKVGETGSIADSSCELDREIEDSIKRYQIFLEHRGYACQIRGHAILARRRIPM